MSRVPKSLLVLVVDDDLTTTRVLVGLLRAAGFETITAHSKAEAEARALNSPISLILLDVHLPDGDSFDLCEKLTKLLDAPILFISANDDVTTKVKGFAAGGVDYITKPLASAEVLARVRTHLRLRAAYESLSELQAARLQTLAASQQQMMPQPADIPDAGFEACVRQVLSAGGDFYDVIPVGNQITDFVVADASGHDLGTSLWTASFKTLLTEYGSILHAPLDICRMINTSLMRVLPGNTYFSVIYARLNRTSNKLTLVNAGHPSALLVSGESHETKVLEQDGDLIGVFSDASFGQLEISVNPSDRLYFYSDGLIEAAGSREIGLERLTDACRTTVHMPLKEAVTSVVNSMRLIAAPEDDVVLLGVTV